MGIVIFGSELNTVIAFSISLFLILRNNRQKNKDIYTMIISVINQKGIKQT